MINAALGPALALLAQPTGPIGESVIEQVREYEICLEIYTHQASPADVRAAVVAAAKQCQLARTLIDDAAAQYLRVSEVDITDDVERATVAQFVADQSAAAEARIAVQIQKRRTNA